MKQMMKQVSPLGRPRSDPSQGHDRFVTLFNAHAPDLLAYLVRRVERRVDAADLLADVFVVAWRRLADVPADPEARLWLFGVARRVLATHRRGQRRHVALGVRLSSELATAPTTIAPRDPDRAVGVALAKLSRSDRELLLLVGWDGLSPAEAAALLEIEAGTARVRLHRARTRFARLLEDEPEVKRNGNGGHEVVAGSEIRSGAERRKR